MVKLEWKMKKAKVYEVKKKKKKKKPDNRGRKCAIPECRGRVTATKEVLCYSCWSKSKIL